MRHRVHGIVLRRNTIVTLHRRQSHVRHRRASLLIIDRRLIDVNTRHMRCTHRNQIRCTLGPFQIIPAIRMPACVMRFHITWAMIRTRYTRNDGHLRRRASRRVIVGLIEELIERNRNAVRATADRSGLVVGVNVLGGRRGVQAVASWRWNVRLAVGVVLLQGLVKFFCWKIKGKIWRLIIVCYGVCGVYHINHGNIDSFSMIMMSIIEYMNIKDECYVKSTALSIKANLVNVLHIKYVNIKLLNKIVKMCILHGFDYKQF